MSGRAEFVVGFVETLQSQGYTHEQCKVAAEVVGELAEAFPGDELYELFDDFENGRHDHAMDKLAAVPLGAILSSIKDFGVAGLGGAANITGEVARGLIDAGPTAALLGLAGPAALGYGAGHATAGLFDDPDKVISEAKHREIVSRLRENARLLQQKTPAESTEAIEYDQQTVPRLN